MKTIRLLATVATLFTASVLIGLLTSCTSNPSVNSDTNANGGTPASLYANAAPLDLRLSAWPYPYPTKEFKTSLQGVPASMIYMDVAAQGKQKEIGRAHV